MEQVAAGGIDVYTVEFRFLNPHGSAGELFNNFLDFRDGELSWHITMKITWYIQVDRRSHYGWPIKSSWVIGKEG